MTKGSYGTSCSVCSSQPGCEVPRALSFSPGNGAAYGGDSGDSTMVVRISFSSDVSWCQNSGPVAFWCDGQALPLDVPRKDLILSSRTLRADVTELVNEFSRSGERECGLTVSPTAICNAESVPFGGVTKAEYHFVLHDAVPPAIIAYDPVNRGTGVALDGVVTFTFSEPIVLGSYLVATLSRLEVDRSGTAAAVQSAEIQLASPYATVENNRLRLQLGGHLRAGLLYTLSLPAGAVADSAGNTFKGLPVHSYTFRAVTASLRSGMSAGGGPSVPVVIAIVTGTVAVAGLAAVGAMRVLKARHDRWVYLWDDASPVAAKRPSVGHHGLGPGMMRSPSTARSPHLPPQGRSAPESAWQGPDPNREPEPWAHPAGSSPNVKRSGPPPSASSRVHPERAGAAPSQEPPPQQPGGTQRPSVSSGGSASTLCPEDACSEVRDVAKQMRDMMDQPMGARKKTFKDLMLEYHPDKNSHPRAKEVFQFVNNARGWFLHES